MKRGSLSSSVKFLLVGAAAICLTLIPMAVSAQDDDPPSQAGRLAIVNGNVSVQPAGTQEWGQAYLNYPLGPGDRIYTDADGRAEIQVGRTYVRVGPNSDVTFVDFRQDAVTFGAAQGALHIRTRGLWQGQSLYVQTPSGTSTVTGPADFRVDIYPDQQTAIFTSYEGQLYLSGANDFGMDMGQGQAVELVGTNPVSPQWLQPGAQDDLDQWSERRDQQMARAASYQYVSPDASGAEDLDAYGQWQPGTEYGDMWFPQVQAGWEPYHNGRWVNHEPWGWTWVEDEPWGYTPFHYGRWVRYHERWGWIPGAREEHPVWSPALVVFAGGIGGGGVSAWFPLGPGEAYHPWYRASPRYVDRVNITNIRETNIVHVQKTYVNVTNVNVTNINYVNRTTGVTAMRHEDFAAGRPVSQAAVRVDPQQMAHAQVIARPQVQPTRTAIISRPPARPVPVAATRPMLINAKGMEVKAQPKAQPAPVPVRAAPRPPALPNRVAVAPPPNVKMTATARQAMQNAPHPVQQQQQPRPGQPPEQTRPGQAAAQQQQARPGQPPAQQQQTRPGHPPVQAPAPGRPVTTPPAQGERPAPIPTNRPQAAPIPAPGTRPPAEPVPQTNQRPGERPSPTTQPGQPPRPQERPAPYQQQAPPPRPNERPAPNAEPNQPPRPGERPAPHSETAPPPRAQERPTPYQQPAPQSRQMERPAPPPPQVGPEPRREAPPQQHAAPPPSRQSAEPPPRSAPHQQPPPSENNRRPDEKDKQKPH